MPPLRVQFPIWRLMAVIGIVACSAGAVLAFSAEPNTAANVLTGWGALYWRLLAGHHRETRSDQPFCS
jgi:hypothetical protein